MCRMYEERFPEVETCVMVNVRQITDIGTYVHLLEYNNIEGMILLSELTRRRIRSIQKLVRIGKNEVAVVMRVDKEKGYIDLSKRRATPEDIAECEERYNKSKAVHSIMRHVADRVNMDLEELYTLYCWPLYKQYGHAYEAFKMVIVDPDSVLNTLDIPEHIKKELVNGIRRRLTPQPIKIRADVECSCFGYEGIDAVKAALTAGEQCSTEDVNIKIRLVAPPLYVLSTYCIDKNLGINLMEQAIAKIEEVVKSHTGSLVVKMKPRAVSESDEAELQKLMDKMEQENKEVDGDSEEEEGEDME
ncbi:eukaryotic translation initiation factor 2 alpha subunit-domain-containing protein [Globomyces pollinis-pini]|nr:eukaryotic translation initiation factor 2 alpha subunit-domain-containing protein [Globomyces pollinis-pini]